MPMLRMVKGAEYRARNKDQVADMLKFNAVTQKDISVCMQAICEAIGVSLWYCVYP